MKSVLGIIAIIAFISLGVFGFLAMNHNMASGHIGCIAASSQAATCPSSIFSLAVFHISFLKSFSQSMMPFAGLILIYTLSFALFAAVLKKLLRDDNIHSLIPVGAGDGASLPKQQLSRWLTILEKRDPYLPI